MSYKIDKENIQDWLTYDSDLKFEVMYSNSGVARIYVSDRKTSFTAGGYGYDKESSVIARMINELIGKQNYNKELYGNSRAQGLGSIKGKGVLSGGTGFSSIQTSFNSLAGCKLEKIYSGFKSDVYSLKVSKRIKNALNKELESFRLKRGY